MVESSGEEQNGTEKMPLQNTRDSDGYQAVNSPTLRQKQETRLASAA